MTVLNPMYMQKKGYPARMDRLHHAAMIGDHQGVCAQTDYVSTAVGGNMQLSVSAGDAFVTNSFAADQGSYLVHNDGAVIVTHANGDASLPRIDLVVLRVYDSTDGGGASDGGQVEVVKGTPTSGATLANLSGAGAMPANSIILAYVLVPQNATTLTTATNVLDARRRRRGYLVIPGTDTRTNTAYGTMATPDIIRNLEVPVGGLITIGYQALAQATAASADAAIFIGPNQLKRAVGGGAPQPSSASLSSVLNKWETLASSTSGLAVDAQLTDTTSDVTTGQVLGNYNSAATIDGTGMATIFINPGVYDVSIQFKSTSGNVLVKERKMWVSVFDPSNQLMMA